MRRTIGIIMLASAAALMITVASAAALPTGSPSGAAPQLFTLEPTPDLSTAKGSLAQVLADPAVQDVTFIKVNPAHVSQQTQDLAVTLPDGKTAQFHLRDFSAITADIQGWVGYKPSTWKAAHAPSSAAEIDIDPLYYLSLARQGDALVGSVIIDGQRYQIDRLDTGQQILVKVDESKLPKEAEPPNANVAGSSDEAPTATPRSAHSTLRVLFVTTNQRRAHSPTYKLMVANALNDANQYMINSHVAITYELAGVYDADYDETGKTYSQLLNDLHVAQPFADEVLRQRESLGADLVSLYAMNAQYCGMAWLTASKAQAHSVYSCSLALAHELGHNLGVNHGWKAGDAEPNPPYIHGYQHTGVPAFHTVMVSAQGALPFFSNPRLQYQGVPMGTTDHHDAARRFNERRETVENFYPPVVTFTLFEQENYEGRSCTITHARATQDHVYDACAEDWVGTVSSLKVSGLRKGMGIKIWSSDHKGVLYNVEELPDNSINLPHLRSYIPQTPGATGEWSGGSLDDQVFFVISLGF